VDWNSVELSRASPVPLYYQLVEVIRDSIAAGELQPEEQLPPERDLARQLGISRLTARQALSLLVRDGTLAVRHGIGTFVAAPKLSYHALHLVGFTEDAARRGKTVSSRVLEQTVVDPPVPVARDLGLQAASQTTKIVRLRSSAGTPLVLETSHIPLHCCPGLVDEDLAHQSLYALLERRFGLPLQSTSQTVEATVADEFEAGLFGIKVGAPVLLVEGVAYSVNRQPVERFRAAYRGDRVTLTLEDGRVGPDRGELATSQVRLTVSPGSAH
jgi:GntR family transcriptional regulator